MLDWPTGRKQAEVRFRVFTWLGPAPAQGVEPSQRIYRAQLCPPTVYQQSIPT